MYPNIPFNGLSWPFTQHAGVISEEIIRGLISACMLCNGRADDDTINNYLISNNLLTANFRKDSQKEDAWRDYQQILSELGLIYSTNITKNEIILTPIAIAFADGDISYAELITLQVLRYQYPNGHKTQSSSALKKSYQDETGHDYNFTSFADMQNSMGILIRPAVVVWKILYSLFLQGENAVLSIDELQNYVVRCITSSDVPFCVQSIINSRHSNYSLQPLERARRNMQDWIKLLDQTPLFYSEFGRNCGIGLTQYSIDQADAINAICSYLCQPETFWYYSNTPGIKVSWFDFYGNIDIGTKWIPKQNTNITDSDISSNSDTTTLKEGPRSIDLQSFKPIGVAESDGPNKTVVSIYDYKKSEQGHKLHNNMVNIIAARCIEKGADVYYDSKTVDLYIKYKGQEFIVEVKSITPSNFIARLRTAIGQVNQYDFIMHRGTDIKGRLGLGFAANIPRNDWTIPFITDYMNMDLLCLNSNSLSIRSNNSLSMELYG